MVQVASQGLLFGSGPTLTSGRQKAALVHGARWEPRPYPACEGQTLSRQDAVKFTGGARDLPYFPPNHAGICRDLSTQSPAQSTNGSARNRSVDRRRVPGTLYPNTSMDMTVMTTHPARFNAKPSLAISVVVIRPVP